MKKISYEELLKNPYNEKTDRDQIEFFKKVSKMEANIQKLEQNLNEEKSKREELKLKMNTHEQNVIYENNQMRNEFDLFADSFNKALDNIRQLILTEVNDKLDKFQKNLNQNKTISNQTTMINDNDVLNSNNIQQAQTQRPTINKDLSKIVMSPIIQKSTTFNNNTIADNGDTLNTLITPKMKNKLNKSDTSIIEERINKIEHFLSIPLPNRDTEINTNIEKVANIEKLLDSEFMKINGELSKIKQIQSNIQKEIEIVKGKNTKDNTFEKFHKDFLDTSKNISQLVYQNTLVVKEGNNKINQFQNILKSQLEELGKYKADIDTNLNILQSTQKEEMNKSNEWLNTTQNMIKENQESFENNVFGQNEKFVNFIQDKMTSFLNEITTKVDNIEKALNKNENDIVDFNDKYTSIQKVIFQQMNEMEECLNNKYEIICRKLNIPK